MLASYMGVLLISNPELLNSEMRAKYFNVDSILTFAKRHHFAIFMSISANVFNAFNFLAARSISSQVHPCIETMYIGIVQTLISIICLICYKPSCFKFWRSSYTQEQVLFTLIISLLYYLSQESQSMALDNLKAGTVATFNHLSALLAYIGYKFFRVIAYKKLLLGKSHLD